MNSTTPPFSPVKITRATCMGPSPLKGRTAQRRSRRIIRTGAHAVEEAKERVLENGVGYVSRQDFSDITPGKNECDIIAGENVRAGGSVDNTRSATVASRSATYTYSRRRHKRRKSNRYVNQQHRHECQNFTSATDNKLRNSDTPESNPSHKSEVHSHDTERRKTRNKNGGEIMSAATSENIRDGIVDSYESSPLITSCAVETDVCNLRPNNSEIVEDRTPLLFSVPEGHRSFAESRAMTRSVSCPHRTLANDGVCKSTSPNQLPLGKCHASIHSSISLLSGTSRSKEHLPEPFDLGCFMKSSSSSSGGSAVIHQESPEEPSKVTGCCRDAAMAQDIGNYRMLIDDLSYLCSAIIQCKTKPVQCDQGLVTTIHKHTPVTAFAACNIAELISHSGTRSKLLIVSAEGARVGALGAVLESIACAPLVLDLSVMCRKLIHGHSFQLETGIQHNGTGTSCNHCADDEPVLEFVSGRSDNCRHGNFHGENTECKPDTGNEGVSDENLFGRRYYDAISTKALSIISYFVGVDCTVSDRATVISEGQSKNSAVQLARECVLQHKPALHGIARLVADDPVVHAYLHEAMKTSTSCKTCLDNMLASNDMCKTISLSSNLCAPLYDVKPNLSTHCDPTKLGRQSRMKRNLQLDASTSYSHESSRKCLDLLPLPGPQSRNCSKSSFAAHPPRTLFRRGKFCEKPSSLDFLINKGGMPSHESENIELGTVDKYEEKILLALSRAELTHTDSISLTSCCLPSACSFCNIWVPSMILNQDSSKEQCSTMSASSLALVAADCIITGRDKLSAEVKSSDLQENADLTVEFHSNGQNLDGLTAKNPILYANEMLRLSGSLPHYSRSMAETLVAILLSSKSTVRNSHTHGNPCPKCITYLQHRASSLSEIIDSLCCLSPNASLTLSLQESFLVPSLLRAIAELSFAANHDQSPLCYESISTALKTLTSLTHENSLACDQIVNSYCWKILLPAQSQDSGLSNKITGLDIIFSYLFKTVLSSQSKKVSHKTNYDSIIFCLNILTNVVEMVPNLTKSMIENIVVNEGLVCAESGLSWLARWVVSKTLGFQGSVMKGSFGSQAAASSTGDVSELETGEEDNLVTSGNGFVLLAYLMADDDTFPSHSIRNIILRELPSDKAGNSGGIQFMIKMLKAFCNFYHYSVGDLSVAVIAPVVKLISGLEKMELVEQRKKV